MREAIVLGVVQGITEFLPISSTAHLVLLPRVLGWESPLLHSLAFDVALHAGTLLSVIVCFRAELQRMIMHERRLIWFIAAATVPAGMVGLLLGDYIEGAFRDPRLIALMLVVFGVVMLIAERWRGNKEVRDLTLLDAMTVGIAQAIAVVPGVSRSGITISAGLVRGMRRDDAARFSFLLSIPVIAAASALGAKDILSDGGLGADMSAVAAGFLAAFATGVGAIVFLLRFLKTFSLNTFVVYRFALAGAIALWMWPQA
jgi:undecaprenyl-diphosphatase